MCSIYRASKNYKTDSTTYNPRSSVVYLSGTDNIVTNLIQTHTFTINCTEAGKTYNSNHFIVIKYPKDNIRMTDTCTFSKGYCMTFPISRYVIVRITDSTILSGHTA